MYTEADLKEKYYAITQKIADTKITDEVFDEIQKEIIILGKNQQKVREQILAKVAECNTLCELDKKIQGTANKLFYELKLKQLTDSGVDLSKVSATEYGRYNSYLSHNLIYGDFLKVEAKKTMR